jgi:hypothetical protein
MHALALAMAGRTDEAREVLRKAIEADPLSETLRERLAELGG